MPDKIWEDLDWHKDANGRWRFVRDGMYFYSDKEWDTWCEWKHYLKWQGQLLRKECSFIEFAKAVLDADYQYAKPKLYSVYEEQLEEA